MKPKAIIRPYLVELHINNLNTAENPDMAEIKAS
jgi:hypothetical protein